MRGAGGWPGGAWPPLALSQAAAVTLMRMRFSSFLPAQLLHVLAAAACVGASGAAPADAALCVSQLLGFGWCAPSLLALALDASSRHTFAHGSAPRAHGRRAALKQA
ncbi:hypothetical protein MNEG_14616 [Monoraphidium neglectum]|uniref:Uncharacterized protein n=1 Tax=Monoraphidium neglectum TaxID=145388 RepID=A0A0D2MDQ9_9CHLO|nr:hypothetical protein MNEG_14616 [Monoraphidium neglectum]KIY93345.1 hypothetical protein MNEG_14616 [Monoraphidium neglectum]|eukprot:XP_013892365.1 hypothetical protein MNEG_14616 [Monoraphidium neglectum]